MNDTLFDEDVAPLEDLRDSETRIAVPAPVESETLPALSNRRGVNDVIEAMRDLKAIRTFIANELTKDTDYGVIPGTGNKKNLLKPGAEKVNMFFNVRPEYDIERNELGAGHVEFIVKTHLISRNTQEIVGAGVGSCSTMETKYRYRGGDAINTGEPVPSAYWKDRDASLIGGKSFKPVKGDDGKWYIGAKGEKTENPDIADVRNTVLKMAKKRSLVDASIGLGCLSEFFTQDMEDMDVFEIDTESKTGAGRTGTSEQPAKPSVQERESSADPSSERRSSPEPPPAERSAPDVSGSPLVAIIAPRSFGKLWEQGGFVIDDNDKRWTFPKKLLNVAERAITEGMRLKIAYKKNKNYWNVDAAEVIA